MEKFSLAGIGVLILAGIGVELLVDNLIFGPPRKKKCDKANQTTPSAPRKKKSQSPPAKEQTTS